MTPDEAEELFSERAHDRDWATWNDFKETLMHISNGHIGVFMQGLRMLEGMRLKAPRRPFSEDDAVNQLRGPRFFDRLERCFPSPGVIPQDQRDYILDTIVQITSLSTSGDTMEVDDSVEDGSKLALLKRGGILAADDRFTCLAAEWYYYNRIFPGRASRAPASVDALVTDAVCSMSATRLRGACNGGFPKEAAFQQLFNEAISRQLPRRNIVIPELNTQAVVEGETKSGELDFYINGELQWALELLRKGDLLEKHIHRFHPTSGTYRNVQAKAFLVVDCRGPKTRAVQRMEERCTLYFSEDFRSCICAMRNEQEVVLDLQE
jgi:hypothetical protein